MKDEMTKGNLDNAKTIADNVIDNEEKNKSSTVKELMQL
jgi:hypothetical protein